MKKRTPIYTGMTVRVRARGPIILPLPLDSTGPFPIVDLRIQGGSGFARLLIDDANEVRVRVGGGQNYRDDISLEKPGGGYVRLYAVPGPQFRLSASDTAVNALPYIDFTKPGGQVVRVSATDNNDISLALVT